MLFEPGEAFVDAAAALVELDTRPGEGLGLGEFHGRQGRVEVEHRNAAKAAAVDGGRIVAPEAGAFPLAFEQIQRTLIGSERFRRGGAELFGQRIPLGCRRDNRHARPPIPNQRVRRL